jgi:hypothetical protein
MSMLDTVSGLHRHERPLAYRDSGSRLVAHIAITTARVILDADLAGCGQYEPGGERHDRETAAETRNDVDGGVTQRREL